MTAVLRLCEDILSSDAALALPALARLIFVVHGTVTVGDRVLRDGEAWHGEGAVTPRAGKDGATAWRWELAGGTGTESASPGAAGSEKLAARLETLPKGELLLRGDSVAFPPGGCAYLHRHQGPGIRCLIEGGIRIDTHGRSTCYGPGGAWYESGPEPGFCSGRRRPPEPLHSGDDPPRRVDRQELDPVPKRGGQVEAARAAVQGPRRCCDRAARAGIAPIRRARSPDNPPRPDRERLRHVGPLDQRLSRLDRHPKRRAGPFRDRTRTGRCAMSNSQPCQGQRRNSLGAPAGSGPAVGLHQRRRSGPGTAARRHAGSGWRARKIRRRD